MTSECPVETSILERLDELCDMGDSDMVSRIVASFLIRAPAYLSDLADTLDRGNFDAFIWAAHSLNGAAGNLGASAMSTLCLGLETLGRENRPQPAPDLLNSLYREYDIVRGVLEAVLAG